MLFNFKQQLLGTKSIRRTFHCFSKCFLSMFPCRNLYITHVNFSRNHVHIIRIFTRKKYVFTRRNIPFLLSYLIKISVEKRMKKMVQTLSAPKYTRFKVRTDSDGGVVVKNVRRIPKKSNIGLFHELYICFLFQRARAVQIHKRRFRGLSRRPRRRCA